MQYSRSLYDILSYSTLLSHTLKHLLGNPAEGEKSVDVVDNPIEEAAIHSLGHGILGAGGFFYCVIAGDDFSFGHHAVRGQGLSQVSRVNAKQFRHCGGKGISQ